MSEPNENNNLSQVTHLRASIADRNIRYALGAFQVDIQPPERETIFSDELRSSDPRNVGPCGGFSTQYGCMCDFHGVPYRFVPHFNHPWSYQNVYFCLRREEVAWDIDTIYLSHDTRILNLRDFDHLEPKWVDRRKSRSTKQLDLQLNFIYNTYICVFIDVFVSFR